MCCVVLCCVVVFCRSYLGSIFGRFGGVLGRFLVVLGRLGASLGALGGSFEGLGGSWAALGRLLESLGAVLDRSWVVLGRQGRFRLNKVGQAPDLAQFLEPKRGPRWSQNATQEGPKSKTKTKMKTEGFEDRLGAILGRSWVVLGGVLGP